MKSLGRAMPKPSSRPSLHLRISLLCVLVRQGKQKKIEPGIDVAKEKHSHTSDFPLEKPILLKINAHLSKIDRSSTVDANFNEMRYQRKFTCTSTLIFCDTTNTKYVRLWTTRQPGSTYGSFFPRSERRTLFNLNTVVGTAVCIVTLSHVVSAVLLTGGKRTD